MNIDEIAEILDDAKRIHRGFLSQIDLNKDTLAKAIYILQGGAITAVYNALKFNVEGMIVARAQQARMISEITDTIDYFITQDDNSRFLKQWFKGTALDIKDPKRGMQAYMSEDNAKLYRDLGKELGHFWSKYMHASIAAMRFNMRKISGEFDYDCALVAGDQQYMLDMNRMATLFVAPGAIYPLIIGAKILTPTIEDFDKLSNYAKSIEGLPKTGDRE